MPAANFNKNNTQQIFQNKTLGGIGQVSGGAGAAGAHGNLGAGHGFGGAAGLGGLSERKNSEGGPLIGDGRAMDGQLPSGAAGLSGRKE